MPEPDLARLRHMLDAAREIGTLTAGMSRDVFTADRVVSLAVTRLLEVLGEAASPTGCGGATGACPGAG